MITLVFIILLFLFISFPRLLSLTARRDKLLILRFYPLPNIQEYHNPVASITEKILFKLAENRMSRIRPFVLIIFHVLFILTAATIFSTPSVAFAFLITIYIVSILLYFTFRVQFIESYYGGHGECGGPVETTICVAGKFPRKATAQASVRITIFLKPESVRAFATGDAYMFPPDVRDDRTDKIVFAINKKKPVMIDLYSAGAHIEPREPQIYILKEEESKLSWDCFFANDGNINLTLRFRIAKDTGHLVNIAEFNVPVEISYFMGINIKDWKILRWVLICAGIAAIILFGDIEQAVRLLLS